MTKSHKSKQSESDSYSWEHLLDSDSNAGDIESIVTREFGPLHRPPNLVNARKSFVQGNERIFSNRKMKSRKTELLETDETMVTYYALPDVVHKRGALSTRYVTMWVVLGALCVASFATANLILDTFHLGPQDIALASQHSVASQQFMPNVNPSKRFAEMRQALLQISDSDALSNLHTPQLKALDWVANRDGLQLAINATNLPQRYALAVLFYSTTGSGWKRPMNWLSDQHECEWIEGGGVRSCSDKQEVTDLSLWNNLKGTIPTEIFQLSKLKILYLARNELYGTIPSQLGLLTDLEYLGLHHNRLNGTLPSEVMGNMKKLRSIYVEKNEITGTIRRIDPLCQLRTNAKPPQGQPAIGGALIQVTADCKSLVKWKPEQVACGCCTKCYL